MNYFGSMKLKNKFLVAFIIIFILFSWILLWGYWGFTKVSKEFNNYNNIDLEQELATKIESDLLYCRVAFKDYYKTADESQVKIFRERFAEMQQYISKIKSISKDEDRLKEIDAISQEVEEYNSEFENVNKQLARRNEIKNTLLVVKGEEMIKNLQTIMDFGFKSGNEVVARGAAEALTHLSLGRIYTVKALELYEKNVIDSVRSNFSEMVKNIDSLKDKVNTYDEKYYYNIIVGEKEVYLSNVDEGLSLNESIEKSVNRADEISPTISKSIEDIKLNIMEEKATYGPTITQDIRSSMVIMITVSIFAAMISFSIIVVLVRLIVEPVRTITNTFKDISEGEGDLSVRISPQTKDEIGEMSSYFDIFMDKLQVVFTDIKKQNQLKTWQSDFNDIIRGEQEVNSLGETIIGFLSAFLDAKLALLYLADKKDSYNIIASYAYRDLDKMNKTVNSGEGLIGQCVLQKKIQVINNLPEDYMKIGSSLGEALPRNIMLIPCIYNNKVIAVIELGSFEEFTKENIEFVESISQSIAISLNSADASTKMQELLIKTQEQAEELQMQQEELRVTNEELEEQAKILKESELILQSQQEELKVTNEELEERTEILEKQKADIVEKNEILEKAQYELEVKAKELEVTSRYKSEFLANMSHELRTPLNSILVLSQMLSSKKNDSNITEKDLEYAKTIYSSGSDLLQLINDILDLSKIEAGKVELVYEDINLNDISDTLKRNFDVIASSKGLNFIIEINEDLPKFIYSDFMKLQQILRNLLSNAFKFTEKGYVKLKIDRSNERIDCCMNSDSDKYISISVIDTGIGVPSDKKEIIFEAFKQIDGTTSRKYDGTGLGLSISKELARLLGGKIILNSEEGQGSEFTLIIPEKVSGVKCEDGNVRKCEKGKKEDNKVEILNDISYKPITQVIDDDLESINKDDKTILVIDDDLSFCKILVTLIRAKGFKCVVANDGITGIKQAEKLRPSAIILDIGLPDIQGYEVADRLKKNLTTKNIPIHIISAHDEVTRALKESDILGYLKKPVELNQLNEMLEKISHIVKDNIEKILILTNELEQGENISKIFNSKEVSFKLIQSGEHAYKLLKDERFDCLILDVQLEDMTGFQFLDKLNNNISEKLPIIIYTDKEISEDEEIELNKHANSIIIDGPKSIDRLLEEVKLFIYDVNKNVNSNKLIKHKEENLDNNFKNRTILLVDDDMRNVFALSSYLEGNGFKVVVGKNGREALDKLDKNSNIDLILMDIMMPEMDGYEAMGAIRKNKAWKDIPIIALTAKAMKDDKAKCIEAGANDYMTKPIDIEKLMSLVRVWMHK
ncbi:MAG: response regulator [Clostridiaceae bacterium]